MSIFKISLPGYDVSTATPEQCSIHSDYDTLKIKLDPINPQFGNIVVTFRDNPPAGTYPICTINYNYGYVPACYFYFSVRDSTGIVNAEVGNTFPLDENVDAYFQVNIDTQKVTFSYVVTPSSTDTPSGFVYAFRYYIFANDGI